MLYFADNARHLVCVPYSRENLHAMAAALGIKKHWFHASPRPHYDIPKKMVDDIRSKVGELSRSELLRVTICTSIIGKTAKTKTQVHLFGHVEVPVGSTVQVIWADQKLGLARVEVDLEPLAKLFTGEHEFDILVSDLVIDD